MKHSQYHILEDSIAFDCYELRFSSLRKNNIITLDRIQEVDFNTVPYSMEIDEGEIIFFNHDDKERIKDFAQKHQLPLAYKPDVWQMLCAPIVDTKLKEAQIRLYREKLQELHFSSTAIKQIRKKVKPTLLGTREWLHLGQWDLLAAKQARSMVYRLKGRDFYWWTMQVTLQGKQYASKKT